MSVAEFAFRKFLPLVKVDETTHRVFGISSSEKIDSDNEIADYAATKAAYEKWSEESLAKTKAAGQDPSLGNIRIQHDHSKIGGKATRVDFHDDSKETWLETEPLNDEVWKMLKGGFLTGYSQGGAYAWRKCNACGTELSKRAGDNYCRNCAKTVVVRYGPTIGEVSYVDRGANPDAVFAYVRADGSTEMCKFAQVEDPIAKLSEADIERIAKALKAELSASVAATETLVKKVQGIVEGLEEDTALGETHVKPEQLKKAAEALGISVEEFEKQMLAHFESDTVLVKGHKGLAALGHHLKKAHAHHQKMVQHHAKISEMHKDHAAHHATMADHMENCMKAHGACMDGGESEKVFKAAVEELEKAAKSAPVKEETTTAITADEMKKAVDAAVTAALEKAEKEKPADKGRLFPVPRISADEMEKARKDAEGKTAAQVDPVGV